MSRAVQYRITGRTASAVAASVEAGIRDGRLGPGAPLPTVRALASLLGVSPATISSAYRTLGSRGLLSAQGRRGTRVTHRPPLAAPAPAPVAPHLRNLADGNPDPALLPPLRPALAQVDRAPHLYGEEAHRPGLLRLARKQLEADGIPALSVAVVGGALDGVERVLQAHLRPGDRVAVEDPGYTGVLDLVSALGLVAEPVGLDDSGPLPVELRRALRSGAQGFVLTPRAQNPTGAALDEPRARELRRLLEAHPNVLVIEDDHAGPIAGSPALTLCRGGRPRWAVVRSVSKWLGPDLRVAALAGDPATVARVEGRQQLGAGWVSHVLQTTVEALWSDAALAGRLRSAAETYASRRRALLDALAARGIRAHGRSGLNVWVPVAEEGGMLARLAEAGWAVRGGERYRMRSRPALRITVSTLAPHHAERLAADIDRALAPAGRTSSA